MYWTGWYHCYPPKLFARHIFFSGLPMLWRPPGALCDRPLRSSHLSFGTSSQSQEPVLRVGLSGGPPGRSQRCNRSQQGMETCTYKLNDHIKILLYLEQQRKFAYNKNSYILYNRWRGFSRRFLSSHTSSVIFSVKFRRYRRVTRQ